MEFSRVFFWWFNNEKCIIKGNDNEKEYKKKRRKATNHTYITRKWQQCFFSVFFLSKVRFTNANYA